MAVLGLYCGDDLLAQEMEEMVTALCMGVGYGRKAAREADYELRRIPSLSELEEEVMAGDEMFYLILAGEKPEKAFAATERLWEESPSLSIILVVSEAEYVFSALSYPFFHLVRRYALEQDLGAAFQKMERSRPPVTRWHTFLCRNELVRVRQKDILYLESDRHEIRIHCREEIICTTEPLSRCEERLKAGGFARIHKSFLVSLYHVNRMDRDSVTLDNGEKLYISRYRYPEVKLQFEGYIRHLDFL